MVSVVQELQLSLGFRMTHSQMNRHERRAAKAKSKSVKIDRVVAIHESGHAVARYLTAGDLGFTPDEAISYIDVAPYTPQGTSIEGTRCFLSQATTFGPIMSKELQDVATREFAKRSSGSNLGMQDVAEALAKARAEGADVPGWLRARLLINVFGAAAEARYSDKTFEDVFESYENEGDVRDTVQHCGMAGVTGEAMHLAIHNAKTRAMSLIEQPQVWSAVTTLADKLPSTGRLDGKKVAAIISAAMEAYGPAASAKTSQS
jgi:hypothetical protein